MLLQTRTKRHDASAARERRESRGPVTVRAQLTVLKTRAPLTAFQRLWQWQASAGGAKARSQATAVLCSQMYR